MNWLDLKTTNKLKIIFLSILMLTKVQAATKTGESLTYSATMTALLLNAYVIKEKNLQLSLPSSGERTTRAAIRKNSSRLTERKIIRVSIAFENAESMYDIPAVILQAIAFVESSYRVNAINRSSNDYGIMQVNEYNIKAHNFDKVLLLSDLQYSVNAGAKVFKWFYNRYPLDEAIQRYNCGTRPSCIKLPQVGRYLKAVKVAM